MMNFLKTLTKQVEPEIDKRSATRLSADFPVLYRIPSIIRDWKVAKSVDVSSNGVRLVMAESHIKAGSRLELRLKLPKTPQIFELRGIVVWTKSRVEEDSTECGLEFRHIKHQSHQEKLTHFFADKICVLAFKNLDEFEVHPAASFDELKQVYGLIYKEYLARGYCSEKSSRMHFNYYCVLPETQTFVLKKKEDVVGTISLVCDSPCGIPMESLFPEEIHELRSADKTVAEVSLLSLSKREFHHKGFSLSNVRRLKASFQLFARVLLEARASVVTDLVIAVHPKHESLYQYLNFQIIGSVRSYHGACGKPALPMRLDVKKFLSAIQGKPLGHFWSRFLSVQASRRNEHYFKWDSKTVDELFRTEASVIQSIPEKAKTYINKIYPSSYISLPRRTNA